MCIAGDQNEFGEDWTSYGGFLSPPQMNTKAEPRRGRMVENLRTMRPANLVDFARNELGLWRIEDWRAV